MFHRLSEKEKEWARDDSGVVLGLGSGSGCSGSRSVFDSDEVSRSCSESFCKVGDVSSSISRAGVRCWCGLVSVFGPEFQRQRHSDALLLRISF